MKVLILTPDIYTRGGIARYTWTLASALGGLIGPDNVHVLPLLGTRGSQETPKGFLILHIVTERLTSVAKLRFAGRALKQARHKYDLIICTHVGLAPVAAAIRLVWGSPFWVVCHGVEAWGRLPLGKHRAVKTADLVLPISRFTADRVREVNDVAQGKIKILYNAIADEFAGMLLRPHESARPPLGANSEKRIVLSVGMLSKDLAYKGFDMVIRALPRVLEAVSNLRYVVVGEGDHKENLKRLASEMGVGDKVDFTGEVSDAELAGYYRACDVFVLPSRTGQRNGHWEGEGFGRVYVEAALAGKPVVGSRGGGAAEAVLHGETGLLVDPISVDEVAEAAVTLLNKPDLAATLGSEGREWAMKNFTEDAMCRSLVGILQESGFLR